MRKSFNPNLIAGNKVTNTLRKPGAGQNTYVISWNNALNSYDLTAAAGGGGGAIFIADYDASTNLFPAAGVGSGAAGAIQKGDIFRITVFGTVGGVDVVPGAILIADIAAPGQVLANWIIKQ
jgi:hypothetical protein